MSSHLAILRTLTDLKDVPISLKLDIIESFSFKISKLDKISPVTYKLWHLVSTLNSILGNSAKSSSYTPSYYDKNLLFKSSTSSISSFSIISNNLSCIFANVLTFSFSLWSSSFIVSLDLVSIYISKSSIFSYLLDNSTFSPYRFAAELCSLFLIIFIYFLLLFSTSLLGD